LGVVDCICLAQASIERFKTSNRNAGSHDE